MLRCGLLGEKLGHSYSPRIHSLLGEYAYALYEKSPGELDDFLKNGAFDGLNVTIPYKKAVVPYCAELSPAAEHVGSVNTLVRRADGSLYGDNTDYTGFLYLLDRSGLTVQGKKCLVLGSGGASLAVAAALRDRGAETVVISRSGPDNYENLDRHKDARLIVNATPVGMYPAVGKAALDVGAFPDLEGVLDLIYNPARTKILLDAEHLGVVTGNGLSMLVAQAHRAAELFTGAPIAPAKIETIWGRLRREMENVILVGMPGCGKSTVGRALAQKLGRTFRDADRMIAERAGCSIPEIFAKEGAPGFRTRETEILEELGKQSGLVIATGGGCVTRAENYPLLHQNGTIYFLERGLSKLPKEGRPLSQRNDLEAMYEARLPLYRRFADRVIDNDRESPDWAVTAILQDVEGKT